MLAEIYDILQNQDIKKDKRFFHKPMKAEKELSFNEFHIPQSRQQNKTKEHLSKVLAFIDSKKHLRFSDTDTVLPISVKSKRLKSIYGNCMNVSRGIQFMKEIGLLCDYDETYQFNGYYKKMNHCKLYGYSIKNENIIKQYCKENNINIYKIKNNKKHNNSSHLQNNIFSFERNEVRFSSKLHLLKPDNYSVSQFEDYLSDCLYENYKELEHYQDLADYINETYYSEYPEMQISFEPKFTWSKGNKAVRKIGIRATNHLVSVKNEKEEDDEEWIVYKEDICKQYNLNYSYDVKSSVPRVTYLMNKGVWMDDSLDFYEVMYKKFIEKCPSEYMPWNEKTRKIFKQYHMPAYFDKMSKIASHLKRRISMKVQHYKRDDWLGLDDVMIAYKKSVEETVGKLQYDSEIFYHESCIYMDVLLYLLEKGNFIWQQYDGFYSDKEIIGIEDIIAEISEEYYKRYTNNKIYNNSSHLQNKENDYENTEQKEQIQNNIQVEKFQKKEEECSESVLSDTKTSVERLESAPYGFEGRKLRKYYQRE